MVCPRLAHPAVENLKAPGGRIEDLRAPSLVASRNQVSPIRQGDARMTGPRLVQRRPARKAVRQRIEDLGGGQQPIDTAPTCDQDSPVRSEERRVGKE